MNEQELKKKFEEEYPNNEKICCCGHEYCSPKSTWDSERLVGIWNFFLPHLTTSQHDREPLTMTEAVELSKDRDAETRRIIAQTKREAVEGFKEGFINYWTNPDGLVPLFDEQHISLRRLIENYQQSLDGGEKE